MKCDKCGHECGEKGDPKPKAKKPFPAKKKGAK